jgi:glycine cleavage system H lipoate-binding protein/TusA-related sulfurtransferase
MEINGCDFPEDRLYDLENMVWARIPEDGPVVVGITSILSALAGKLLNITFKALGSEFARGRSIATIESARYVGAVRVPVRATLVEVNTSLSSNPKVANDFPYGDGWFAKIQRLDLNAEQGFLVKPSGVREELNRQIQQLKVRCFKAFPDYEMYEIGVECAAVLVRLNELMERMGGGEVVHIVSDDPTADIEMVRWQDQTGQDVVESRREGNIVHFIVRKIR